MNKYALFLGCTTARYVMQYEIASRWVCRHLGIELVDIDDFACCGFSQIDLDQDASLLLTAMNLAVAEASGFDVLTLCTACTGVLTEATRKLEAEETRDMVNSRLKSINMEYNGGVNIRHISRVLYEDIGVDRIAEKIKDKSGRNFSSIRVAPHYGCHYLKPETIFDGFDDPDYPKTLHQLISITGAQPVNYETMNLCCGGKTFPISKDISFSLIQNKLDNLTTNNIDCMVLHCPTCYLMYGGMQEEINRRFGKEYDLAVIFYPQLLGLALGANPKSDLGLDIDAAPVRRLLEAIEADTETTAG